MNNKTTILLFLCAWGLQAGCMSPKYSASTMPMPGNDQMRHQKKFQGGSFGENILVIGNKCSGIFIPILFNHFSEDDPLKIATYVILENHEDIFEYKILCGGKYLGWKAWEGVALQDAPKLVYGESTFRLEFSTYHPLNKHESWVVQGDWAERGMFEGKPIKAIMVNSKELRANQ